MIPCLLQPAHGFTAQALILPSQVCGTMHGSSAGHGGHTIEAVQLELIRRHACDLELDQPNKRWSQEVKPSHRARLHRR